MSAKTSIEWCTRTWNVVRGCSRVSPGCGGPGRQGGCYAERQAHRFNFPGGPYEGLTRKTLNGPRWTGVVRLVPELLDEPLRWRKPERIFVNSMSDLFHESLTYEAIDRVFAVMALATNHTFMVLTKRPERMLDSMIRLGRSIQPLEAAARGMGYSLTFNGAGLVPWPLPNVMLGVSVEDQQRADARIPILLQTPAAVRFLSVEPMLGAVDLACVEWNRVDGSDYFDALSSSRPAFDDVGLDGAVVDLVIVGAESGPGARPMNVEWVRSLRDQCVAAGTKFFLKQFSDSRGRKIPTPELDGRRWVEMPEVSR